MQWRRREKIKRIRASCLAKRSDGIVDRNTTCQKYSSRIATKSQSDTSVKSGPYSSFISSPSSKVNETNPYPCNEHDIDSKYETPQNEVMHIKSPSVNSYSLSISHNPEEDVQFRHG